VKCVWNHRRGKSLVQHVALHNAACRKGMFNLADYIFDLVSKVRKFPYSESEGASYVSWVDPRKTANQVKIHNQSFRRRSSSPKAKNDYQKREMYTWCVRTRPYQASVPGYSEMLRVASYSSSPTALLAHGFLERVAPADVSYEREIYPTYLNIDMFRPVEPVVTAYHYASDRQVSLRRSWCEVR
jgi:hypothetical protein